MRALGARIVEGLLQLLMFAVVAGLIWWGSGLGGEVSGNAYDPSDFVVEPEAPAVVPQGQLPADTWSAPASAPEVDCAIKGNISFDTGEAIYHVPGQAYYDVTVVNEAYGERWFCSEEEAVAAGWRKSEV